MSSDCAIRVSHLGKCYHIYDKPAHRLWHMLWRGSTPRGRDYWAVKDVGFEVPRGETVGIVGRNGAGKSTLLQMICGTVDPTRGSVSVNGKVAALLELGAGFNPEFTGRENIYLAASLYDLTPSEIAKRFSAIVNFADIGDFIEQPIKIYSSGMFVRLAFAIIAHVDADILVVDEALSVGDAYFQQKCMRFLAEFQRQGGTLLFVSHDMGAVTALCSRAILLRRRADDTYLCDSGSAKDIAAIYLRELYADKLDARTSTLTTYHSSGAGEELTGKPADDTCVYVSGEVNPATFRASQFSAEAGGFGSGQGQIVNAWFQNGSGTRVSEFNSHEMVTFVVLAKAAFALSYPAIGIMLKNRKGEYVMTESTDSYLRDQSIVTQISSEIRAEFRMQLPNLVRGEYTMDLAFAEGPGLEHIQHHWLHDAIVLTVINENVVHGIAGASKVTVSLTIHHLHTH